MTKRVFVTGATGLVGSYLVKSLLDKGYKVRASKRKSSNMDLVADVISQIEWVEGDILDVPFLEDALQDIDWVFHCAAIVSFAPNEKELMFKINVEGTANIVNICLDYKIEKLIHCSSIAAIGRPEKLKTPITEETKWKSSKLNSPYAISKYQSELEVWRGYAEGLPVAIVNPSIILGKGHWGKGSTKIFSQIENGLKFYPLGSTGFVDVRDVVKGLILLAEKNIIGERYIINGVNTSFKEFFTKVASKMNVKPPSIKVSPIIQQVAWRVEKLRSFFTKKTPLITKETAKLSSLSYQYSNAKSKSLGLDYHTLEETLHHVCN